MFEVQKRPGVRLLFDPAELKYDFGPGHPMQAKRVTALLDLLESSALWNPEKEETRLPFQPATIGELSVIHDLDYIQAVEHLSTPLPEDAGVERIAGRKRLALQYGFGDGDTPVLPDMHTVCATIVGGTLEAVRTVMALPGASEFSKEQARPEHIFHPSGGLHHAWKNRASGFCVYDDASIAIAHVLQASEAKVLYLDFDAHHGDGVQRAFYDEPRVMTISFHETGRYLFPGTGDVLEIGQDLGRGYAINIPLEPFTEDDSYIEAMEALLPALITSFAPDLIVSNHGADTHAWDPLTHLSLTTRGMKKQIEMAHTLAHRYCQGRWVALGGGGYDLYRVVPRAWGLVWAGMSDQKPPERLPEGWIERWRPVWQSVEAEGQESQEAIGKQSAISQFPTTFLDSPGDFPSIPRRWQIAHTNRRTISLLRHLLLTSSVRQAFPTALRRSPMAELFDLLHVRGSETPSRTRLLKTARGTLIMRDFCPVSLVERLHPDQGLRAFARLPEREHQLLINISKQSDCALALVHTDTGVIVGQVTIAPGDEWWEGLENVYEVAIEVSVGWRNQKIARELLAFSLELDALEDMILFAAGLSWHWDTKDLGISIYRYRELISRLFGSQGFIEYPTTEPNITMEPANILLVRVGKRIDQQVSTLFFNRLLSSPNLMQF